MAISFNCEHCGKRVEAPDSAGGKRGRCPYCKQSNYIPAPASGDEVYDLAAEDEAQTKQAVAEREKLRQEEADLLDEIDHDPSPPVPLEQREDLKPADVYHYVVNYCLDMASSKLERAETHVAALRKVPEVGVAAVEDFLSGTAVEPALDEIHVKVLQGFLKQLRGELA